MNTATLQLMSDIIAVNLLFHAVLFGGVGILAGYQFRRFVADLPAPREITKKSS